MNKIFWHEGLFLQPHHFEILEKNFEESLKAAGKFGWGVKNVKFNDESLQNGIIELNELSVVFKDGSSVDTSNSVVSTKLLDKEEGVKLVYLGIKKFKNSHNVEVVNDIENIKGNKRFVTDINGEDTKDLYAGDEVANINYLKYVVRIFLENEISSVFDYELVPVAKINLDEKKFVNYIPPIINISDSSLMLKQIEKLYTLFAEKISKLEEYKLPFSSDYSTNKYLKFLNILKSLNKTAAELYVINENSDVHPFEIYRILRKFVAEISVYSDRINFYGKVKNGKNLLKNYSHTGILEVFESFNMLIKELLDEIVMGPEYSVILEEDNGLFSAELNSRIFEKNYVYYLMIKPKTAEDFTEKFLKLAKISSKSRIQLLIQRALHGLRVESVNALEGMPIRDDVFYFKIDTFDKEWQEILKDKSIAVYYKNIEYIELIVMKE